MAMQMIKAADASLQQIRYFAEISGIENAGKMAKDDLLQALTLAGLSTTQIYVDDEQGAKLQFADPGDQETGYDPKNERWCLLRITPDHDADNKLSPVFLAVNDDFLYAKRGVKICIRERFFEVLRTCIETRRVQHQEDGKFGDADVQNMERHPFQFYGYHGSVKRRPQGLSKDVTVYH